MIEILLAVFNNEKFVGEQLQSILDQSFKSVHVIIGDDASTDNSFAILQQLHCNRITLTRSEKNLGILGNFQKLISLSKAPYIMFSDGDDVWQKEKVLKTFTLMKDLEAQHGSKTPLLVHTDLKVVDRNLKTIHPSFWRYSKLPEESSLPRQLVQNGITGCTVMVNRALLDLAMPFPDGIVMHDWWLGLVASSLGKVTALDEPTMLYRQHGSNDIGAKKYGVRSYVNRIQNPREREKMFTNAKKRFRQAELLLERYGHCMADDKKRTLEAFIEMSKSSYLKRRYLMFKHGFYKHGLLRNALELLPVEWLG